MTAPSPRSLTGSAAHHTRAGRIPSPQGPPPPLPRGLPFLVRDHRAVPQGLGPPVPAAPLRALRGGCYYLRYTPLQVSPTSAGAVYYLGTLRVHRSSATVTISGDLYLRHVPGSSPPDPDPADGIPVFARDDYRYYVRAVAVTGSTDVPDDVVLTFEMFRFDAAITAWTNEGTSTVRLTWTTPPPGYPSGADHLTGDVRNAAGSVTGALSLGWVSPHLRRATLEIDRVSAGVPPTANGSAGYGWGQVFESVGWDLTVVEGDAAVPEPSGESWGDAELHAAMLEFRDRSEGLLDVEWRYHLLCVRRIDASDRGIMYDRAAVDVNSAAREGVGIACDWVYDADKPHWGHLRGTRFGDDPATYFRTAVHEVGHAMGLYHNASDNGFMNTTDGIARRAHPGRPFPHNIRWAFHPEDEQRLRHMPDVWVRPGGIQFGENYATAPIAADDLIERARGLQLEVRPVEEVLPLGAPARVDVALVNRTTASVVVPRDLGLRGGAVRGKVVDPAGTVRTFLPLVPCVDAQPVCRLEPGERVTGSATVTHGQQGALFPGPGLYLVVVDVRWDDGGVTRGVTGSATVLVTATGEGDQLRAAHRILSTPDTVLAIAASTDVGGGAAAMEQAAQDPTLGRHYAWLVAKRTLRDRAPSDEACRDALGLLLAGDAPVLNSAERRRAAEALDHLAAPRPAGHRAGARAHAGDADTLQELVDAARQRVTGGSRPR